MKRLQRLVAFPILLFYAGLLVIGSWPTLLSPWPWVVRVRQGVYRLLAVAGIRPGLEVFHGKKPQPDVPRMHCFRVTGVGGERVIELYDDLWRCEKNVVSPVRDPFRVYQHRNLSAALVFLDMGYRGRVVDYPTSFLFALTDYYCRKARAVDPSVQRVSIESEFVTWRYESGQVGHHPMGGYRVCDSAAWVVR